MAEIKRGVVIDAKNTFVAAIQWDAAGPPPKINAPRRGETVVRPEDKKELLTDAAAIADPMPKGRWDPIAKVWRAPTKAFWTVRQRRDMPHRWALTGKIMAWPDAVPAVPVTTQLIPIEPPRAVGQKPCWNDQTAQWEFASAFCLVDPDGLVYPAQLLFGPEDIDVPDGWDIVDPADYEGTDEQGDKRTIKSGDHVDMMSGEVTLQIPNYEPVAYEFYSQALSDAGLIDAFMGFVSIAGVSVNVLASSKLSLNTVLMRDFFNSIAWDMQRAMDDVHSVAVGMQEAAREVVVEMLRDA